MESWSGVMEWSLEWIYGVEFGVDEVRFEVLVAFLQKEFGVICRLTIDRQTLMEWSTVRF